MIKKRGKQIIYVFVISIILVILSSSFLAFAQIEKEVTQRTSGRDPANPLNLPTDINEVKNRSAEKWGYLSGKAQTALLKNSAVLKFDSIMKKLDDRKIFYYLMNENYSFTLSFLILLLMWLGFGSRFGEFLSSFFNFKEWERALIWVGSGLGFSIAMSWIGLYKLIIYLPRSQYLKDVAWWVGILVWIIFIIIAFILYYFMGDIKRLMVKRLKKKREKRTRQNQEEIEEFAEGIREGTGK